MAGRDYTAKDIDVLEGLDPVRKRPGMYIGGVGAPGLHHLVWEIVDNSIDEAMNGHATEIDVTLHKDGASVTVVDNGRGIPVDRHPKQQEPGARDRSSRRCTRAASSTRARYKTSGGLHGVGAIGRQRAVAQAGRHRQARRQALPRSSSRAARPRAS